MEQSLNLIQKMMTRLLGKDEPIPYNLLLLADEFVEVINKYIFDSEIYVYQEDDKIIGLYALYKVDINEAEIKNIAVDSEYQNRGIGKALLNEATARAKEKGFKTLSIGTGDAMMMQLHLYQKAGFEMDMIKKNFYLDNYESPVYENGLRLKHMVMLKKQLD
jgi:ribosomal protein S18 acetylase RimI-like enzyme